MIRKLMLLSTALFALYSESVHGLGLGDLKLNSALNQEFSAVPFYIRQLKYNF